MPNPAHSVAADFDAITQRLEALETRLSDRELRFQFATREDLHVVLDMIRRLEHGQSLAP